MEEGQQLLATVFNKVVNIFITDFIVKGALPFYFLLLPAGRLLYFQLLKLPACFINYRLLPIKYLAVLFYPIGFSNVVLLQSGILLSYVLSEDHN